MKIIYFINQCIQLIFEIEIVLLNINQNAVVSHYNQLASYLYHRRTKNYFQGLLEHHN